MENSPAAPRHPHLKLPEYEGKPATRTAVYTALRIFTAALGTPEQRIFSADKAPRNWRKSYKKYFRAAARAEQSAASAGKTAQLTRAAQAALDYLGENCFFAEGRSLASFIADASPEGNSRTNPLTEQSSNRGKLSAAETAKQTLPEGNQPFFLPWEGQKLDAAAALSHIRRWQQEKIITLPAARALCQTIENPSVLAAPGWTIVVFGGAAELSPALYFAASGARVVAIVRGKNNREALLAAGAVEGAAASGDDAASKGLPSGTRRLQPLPAANEKDSRIPKHSGSIELAPAEASDFIAHPQKLLSYLKNLPGRLVLVDCLYAPGSGFLHAELAADAIRAACLQSRPHTALAFWGTPTDYYYTPDGRETRAVLDVQGPNYLAAKRICRWRAQVAAAEGTLVSANVAPMARTRSVLRNRIFAAAYRGMETLGLRSFAPDATGAIMAALLSQDLHRGPAQPQWSGQAIHCGLWNVKLPAPILLTAALVRGILNRKSPRDTSP